MNNDLAKTDKRYHESIFKKLLNQLLVGLLIFISKMPFWLLYGISDVFYIVIRFVIRYRRKVIYENLTYAFPEKTPKEINRIASRFYSHFCDFSFETIKLYSISEKQMNKQMIFAGMEKLNSMANNGQSFILLGMHHNNWEWCASLQLYGDFQAIMLYNPIRGNQAFEKFLLHARERWGGICVPVHKSARTVFELNKQGKATGLWLGADQTPPPQSKFWTVFLNREAPFFSGPEKIATHTGQPVFFHHVRKTGRGRYETSLIPLVENPQDIEPSEILLRYVRKMESIIREEPEYYLWSHRRWKHKRPEGIELTL